MVLCNELESDFALAEGEEAVESTKLSALITLMLSRSADGQTLGELCDRLGASFKRSTVSSTLYNMKQRDEIEHSESTGKYRLRPEKEPPDLVAIREGFATLSQAKPR